MSNINQMILDFLNSNIDAKYQTFTAKLIPNIEPDSILGVRLPVIRKFVKELKKRDDVDSFLENLPHKYHEENLIHAFLISELKDFDKIIFELDRFLPFVTNWAVCDSIIPKKLSKDTPKLKPIIKKWTKSKDDYKVRFAILSYMRFCLAEYFDKKDLEIISNIQSDEYYVNMARAWYFATALAFKYNDTVDLFENKTLDKFTHNKSIQKAKESFRVTSEHKEYLNSLKQ